MPLNDYLKIESIIADMTATTKDEALNALVEALRNSCPGLDRGSVLAVLHEREALGSTGIGDGVAIPHGKDDSCGGIAIAVGRSFAGCDFDAVDGAKCHVFCLLLAPAQASGGHFRVLAHVARIFKSLEFRKRFMEAEDARAIWDEINAVWRG